MCSKTINIYQLSGAKPIEGIGYIYMKKKVKDKLSGRGNGH